MPSPAPATLPGPTPETIVLEQWLTSALAVAGGEERAWARDYLLGALSDRTADLAGLTNPSALISDAFVARTSVSMGVGEGVGGGYAIIMDRLWDVLFLPAWTHNGVTVGVAVDAHGDDDDLAEYQREGVLSHHTPRMRAPHSPRSYAAVGRFVCDEAMGNSVYFSAPPQTATESASSCTAALRFYCKDARSIHRSIIFCLTNDALERGDMSIAALARATVFAKMEDFPVACADPDAPVSPRFSPAPPGGDSSSSGPALTPFLSVMQSEYGRFQGLSYALHRPMDDLNAPFISFRIKTCVNVTRVLSGSSTARKLQNLGVQMRLLEGVVPAPVRLAPEDEAADGGGLPQGEVEDRTYSDLVSRRDECSGHDDGMLVSGRVVSAEEEWELPP